MRPRSLAEYVGQEHLVGPDGPLRRSVERGYLGSILLWGPPGTGKTSLARLLAEAVGAEFMSLSAVMSGVADIRATVATARERLNLGGARSVLFIDEIHRFNKSQQDGLLPHVEDGTFILIGATTENPYFELNSALLSRLRIWRLEPLSDDDVRTVVQRALDDPQRGLAGALGPAGGVELESEAFDHLVGLAGGDARQALNVLEGATALAEFGRDPEPERTSRPAPGRCRGRRPAEDPGLRPGRRRPLRHGLGLHQEPPRQRSRRCPVLAGHDDRCRRGSPVHRPAPDHQRLRRRRQRRPAGPPGGRGRGPGARPCRAA